MVKESDIPVLDNLIRGLEAAFVKMKKAYAEGNSGEFNKSKKEIIQAQKKVMEVVERN